MRVLMLGWEWPPHVTGGLGVACSGLARALAEIGIDVTFVVPRLVGNEAAGGVRLLDAASARPERPEDPPRRGSRQPSSYATPARVPAATDAMGLRARAGGYGEDILGSVARFAEGAREIARRRAVDVVHGHDWTAYPASEEAARACGAPVVLHVHSTEHDRSGASPHPAIVEIERRSLRRADAVVCVSRYCAAVVSRQYGVAVDRLHVVHNAIPVAATPVPGRVSRRIADPVVLFAGRLTAQKAPGTFLEAAKRVLSREPRARFVVAGTGDLWAESIERAASMGIARHVHFTGFLSPGEIERMFGETDVYVMPSVSEPFGLAAVEAAARGVPVILSRSAGALEALPSALRADFRDPGELAEKILACLRRAELRADVGERGREEAGRLDWRLQAARVVTVYDRVAR